jgi:hypothetical protein
MFVMRNVIVALLAAVSLVTTARAAETCDRQSVMQVDSAQVTVGASSVTIDVFGVSESAGWKNPTLVVAETSGATATVDFVACRPEVSAQVLTPIYARVTLPIAAAVTKIVIRARTNSMDVEITRK